MCTTQFLKLEKPKRQIAYQLQSGKSPTVVFIHGLYSDMNGTKADAISQLCQKHNQQFLRFDLTAHGESVWGESMGGEPVRGESSYKPEDALLSHWKEDINEILNHIGDGAYILIGSSLGAWLAFLTARSTKHKITAIITIAAAIDASHRLLKASLTEAQKIELQKNAVTDITKGNTQYRLTQQFLDDAQNDLFLPDSVPSLELNYPIHFLHSTKDEVVPWQISLEMMQKVNNNNQSQLTLLKDGDHQFSDENAIKILTQSLEAIISPIINPGNNHDIKP